MLNQYSTSTLPKNIRKPPGFRSGTLVENGLMELKTICAFSVINESLSLSKIGCWIIIQSCYCPHLLG